MTSNGKMIAKSSGGSDFDGRLLVTGSRHG